MHICTAQSYPLPVITMTTLKAVGINDINHIGTRSRSRAAGPIRWCYLGRAGKERSCKNPLEGHFFSALSLRFSDHFETLNNFKASDNADFFCSVWAVGIKFHIQYLKRSKGSVTCFTNFIKRNEKNYDKASLQD